MPTPFPGMDPYLESPDLWPDVHSRLIVQLADTLAPRLRPRYYVSVEERTYVTAVPPEHESVPIGRADAAVVRTGPSAPLSGGAPQAGTAYVTVELPIPEEVRETFLEVRRAQDDQVITVVEILSPANKRSGEGRNQYLRKRLAVLTTQTHLVEVDLLRGGDPMPMRGAVEHSDYRILISRAPDRPYARLLPFGVREPIPAFIVPLEPGIEEPEVDLNELVHAVYDRAGYDLRIHYAEETTPSLATADADWAQLVLHRAGLRS